MNEMVKEIKTLGLDLKILYVEDNHGLREGVSELLAKLFTEIVSADNGEHGYQLYLKHLPDIILTDIRMPNMSGFDLAKKIRKDNMDVRIIFLSAFDEKKDLLEAIQLGAFRYLVKPTKVPVLITALYETVLSIHNEQNKRIFESQLSDIFNYQNNLLLMLKEGNPILANRQFLDFFNVESLDVFMECRGGINELLLEHKGFLYSTKEVGWYEKAFDNPGDLFHTKVLNHAGESRHLIMKLRKIPKKDGFTIVSFDDITDLNLMMIFDEEASKNDLRFQDFNTVISLMKVVKENSSEVKLYNYYRGLTISYKAVLLELTKNKIILKTTYSQLKAIKIGKSSIITSELIPYSILCKGIDSIDFDEQTVTFSEVQFVLESAVKRAQIRIEPDEKPHRVTVFRNKVKLYTQTKIIDISICSVKIELDALPVGFSSGESVRIAIVFETDKQPINLLFAAVVYRVESLAQGFYVIFLFELSAIEEEKLRGYIANRQLELIHEFKAI